MAEQGAHAAVHPAGNGAHGVPLRPDNAADFLDGALHKGVVISKYTGNRGKGGCSDASAETISKVTRMFDAAGVAWQVGEYGKVDQGGAGTVAADIAHYGIEVIDCGVPLFSMHSVNELASKYDIYEMYRASQAFFTK